MTSPDITTRLANTGQILVRSGIEIDRILVGIAKDAVSVLDNGKKRELRRGQRLSGDEVLQTKASPAQMTPAPIP